MAPKKKRKAVRASKRKTIIDKMNDIRPFVDFAFKHPDKVAPKNKAKVTRAFNTIIDNRSKGFELLVIEPPAPFKQKKPRKSARNAKRSVKIAQNKKIKSYELAKKRHSRAEKNFKERVNNTTQAYGDATVGDHTAKTGKGFSGVWVPRGLVIDDAVTTKWIKNHLVFDTPFEEGLDFLNIDPRPFAKNPKKYLKDLFKGQPPKSMWKIVTANGILPGRATPKKIVQRMIEMAERYESRGGFNVIGKFLAGFQRVKRKRVTKRKTKRKTKAKRKRKK